MYSFSFRDSKFWVALVLTCFNLSSSYYYAAQRMSMGKSLLWTYSFFFSFLVSPDIDPRPPIKRIPELGQTWFFSIRNYRPPLLQHYTGGGKNSQVGLSFRLHWLTLFRNGLYGAWYLKSTINLGNANALCSPKFVTVRPTHFWDPSDVSMVPAWNPTEICYRPIINNSAASNLDVWRRFLEPVSVSEA